MIKIQIIIGSTRDGRAGEKVGLWIYQELTDYACKPRKTSSCEAELLDLKKWSLPLYDEPTSHLAQKWINKIKQADGYIIVTPEYNHGYPASLKNALDYPYEEWNRKPVGFVSYSAGRGAGIRSVEQLRLVSIELQMAPIREAVHIPFIKTAIDEAGIPKDEKLNGQAKGFLQELLWWTKVLKEARTKFS